MTGEFPLDGTVRRPWSRSGNGRRSTLGSCTVSWGSPPSCAESCTFLALGSASLLAAPMAIAFAVTAFWWNLTRPGGMGAPAVAVLGPCRGCLHGCVECRERIDA